jgi:lipoate-protein ligase A
LASSKNFNFCFISDQLDPYWNLSLEDFFLRSKEFSKLKVLFIWRSTPSVVMGRFQNPWLECDLPKMAQDKVQVVRRQSGGGSVYIDQGNLNFSFIGDINADDNYNFFFNSLSSLNIPFERNKRFDLLVDGKKISGSAFKNTKDSSMHHFSLLVETPLEKISKYLFHQRPLIETKSIRSTCTEVVSLKSAFNITVEDVLSCFEKSSVSQYSVENEFYKKMKSAEWIYGETPKFSLGKSSGESLEFIKGGVLLGEKKIALWENPLSFYQL